MPHRPPRMRLGASGHFFLLFLSFFLSFFDFFAMAQPPFNVSPAGAGTGRERIMQR